MINRFLCRYCRQIKYEDWSDKLLDQFTCYDCQNQIKIADAKVSSKKILVKKVREDRRTKQYRSTKMSLKNWTN